MTRISALKSANETTAIKTWLNAMGGIRNAHKSTKRRRSVFEALLSYGWLAVITPAFLIIPLVHFAARKMEHFRVRSILQTIVIASAGLLLAAAIPLARDALTDPITVMIAAGSLVLLLATKLDTLWLILGAAIVSLSASSLGIMSKVA